MIRVGLPSPLLLRLRLRAHLAATHAARTAHAIRVSIGEHVEAFVGTIRVERAHRAEITATEPVAPPISALLADFAQHYERLVDLLCFSAQGIVYGDANGRLADLRAWFRENYAAVRPVLRPYIYSSSGAADGLKDVRDDFERLFFADNVSDMINSDTLIPVIERTRAALDICLSEHGAESSV
jgi:hypothetical protein